ncbi:MAG: lipocalin-like domain-containing protein [Gemmatimonadales bacterium]
MRFAVRAALSLLSLLAALAPIACRGDRDEVPASRLSLAETLAGADTSGYERALEPRPFVFPSDHGPHPSFRTEWWYVTGNLTSSDARAFGFQLTIFRSALAPSAPALASDWATNQAYMAHFTLTDIEGGRFRAHERFARGAVGLAGARAEPLRVWVGDWSMDGTAVETFPLSLGAAADGVGIELTLDAGKPIVLQGERGLSRKGPEPGNASYYYSFTRLPARGSVVVGGDTLSVSGLAWLDREWSTSALSAGQAGWDWFALQLDDGWDLMAYRLRRADGSADAFSEAVVVDPGGAATRLRFGDDVTLESTGTWTSPIDGAVYPAGWRIAIPARGWDLTVAPRVADQELDLSFRYWEGAVSVRGTGEGGAPVSGRGYVELTGYAGEAPER